MAIVLKTARYSMALRNTPQPQSRWPAGGTKSMPQPDENSCPSTKYRIKGGVHDDACEFAEVGLFAPRVSP